MSSNNQPIFTREQMAAPYRPQDLVTVASFISYCKDRGIKISEKQLEYYDKINLIIPIVRVNRGIVEYRRVFGSFDNKKEWRFASLDGFDPKKYEVVDSQSFYSEGSLHIGFTDPITGKNWLTVYEDDGLVSYPWKEDFRPWEIYKGKNSLQTFVTDPDEIGYEHVAFYSKDQAFAIAEVHRNINIRLSDEFLFDEDADWAAAGRTTQKFIRVMIEASRVSVASFHEVIAVLHEIMKLREKKHEIFQKKFQDTLQTLGDDRQEAFLDAQSAAQLFEQGELKVLARQMLETLPLTTKQIIDRRDYIIAIGRFQDPTVHFFEYLENIPSNSLNQSTGVYRLVLDYYNLANQLGWFLELLGEKPITLKKRIWGRDDIKPCVVCDNHFMPKRRNQLACSPGCTQKHKEAIIKEKRKLGIYK